MAPIVQPEEIKGMWGWPATNKNRHHQNEQQTTLLVLLYTRSFFRIFRMGRHEPNHHHATSGRPGDPPAGLLTPPPLHVAPAPPLSPPGLAAIAFANAYASNVCPPFFVAAV